MTKIKPCPFCGRTPVISELDDELGETDFGGDYVFYVALACPYCQVTMIKDCEKSLKESKKTLIKMWNRRPKARMDPKNPCRNCKHVCEGRAYVGDTAYGNTIDDSDCDYDDDKECSEENGFAGWEAKE